MSDAEETGSFRLGYVPGVTPGKWVRIWAERLPDVPLDLVAVPAAEAAPTLRDGGADVALLRLPIDRTGLSAIPLYAETTVVVVPQDHEVAAVEEATLGDLADYLVLRPLDDSLDWAETDFPGQPALERPETTADAIELVAAGVGLLVVPQSLARLHHRKDLTYRPLTDAPESRVALSWPEEQTTDLVEEFIGIVRGRTVNSTRGRGGGGRADEGAAKATGKATSKATSKAASKVSGSSRPSGDSRKKAAAPKRGKPRRRS